MAYDEDLADRIRELVGDEAGEADTLLAEPGASPLVMRGRPMNGWLRVTGEVAEATDPLERWVARGVASARSLPSKKASSGRRQNARSFSDAPSGPSLARRSPFVLASNRAGAWCGSSSAT